MKYPFIYKALNVPELQQLMGGELVFWREGQTPAKHEKNPPKTRIVWSIPSGIEPSRYYASMSDVDLQYTELSVYSDDLILCGKIVTAIRKLLFGIGEEGFIYSDYETDTKLHRMALQYVFAVVN